MTCTSVCSLRRIGFGALTAAFRDRTTEKRAAATREDFKAKVLLHLRQVQDSLIL